MTPGGWPPSSARLVLSFPPTRRAALVLFVRRLSTTCEGDGAPAGLSRFIRQSRPCRCFAFVVYPTTTTLFLPLSPLVLFCRSPLGNWRKLYAGVRRVKPLECRLTFQSVLTIFSAEAVSRDPTGFGRRWNSRNVNLFFEISRPTRLLTPSGKSASPKLGFLVSRTRVRTLNGHRVTEFHSVWKTSHTVYCIQSSRGESI